MAREKYSVAGRFSRPPLENLKDGCVTAMKKEKSPPEVKRPQTGRECNNKGTDCSALDVTVLFRSSMKCSGVSSSPSPRAVPCTARRNSPCTPRRCTRCQTSCPHAGRVQTRKGRRRQSCHHPPKYLISFFYYRYFKCLKSLFDRLPSGMIA